MISGETVELWAKNVGFAAFAGLVRYNVGFFESRAQFMVFAFLALLLEVGISGRAGRELRPRHVIFPATAAAMAIVVVKWTLEGVSPLIRSFLIPR